VRLVRASSEPLSRLARDLAVNAATLGHWLAIAQPRTEVPPTDDERSELCRLCKENRELRRSATSQEKRRPSSPSTASEISVHRSGEGALSGADLVSVLGCDARRLLRLAPAPALEPGAGGRALVTARPARAGGEPGTIAIGDYPRSYNTRRLHSALNLPVPDALAVARGRRV
jgi:hypothetical protein